MKNKSKYFPGEEWLYCKIYLGEKTADTVLTKAIKPISQYLLKNKIIKKWFFIRYKDPQNHLRVRFLVDNLDAKWEILDQINKKLKKYINSELVWTIQIDTYIRELERYGEKTIELSESIFFFDSMMIINILGKLDEEHSRWQFALKAIDSQLNDFKYNIEDKVNFVSMQKDAYGKEFGMNKSLKRELELKFRNNRKVITEVLNQDINNHNTKRIINDTLLAKTTSTNETVIKILNRINSNETKKTLNELMSSFLHMMINRIFRSNQRLHELVLYDFLVRYYKSEIAKLKYNPKRKIK